jgi:zinc protease
MQKSLALFALLVSAPCYAAAAEQAASATAKPAVVARPWPHEQSDMKPNPKVVWGKLDNGLRYAIRPTKAAPARGSLRMLVLAGSGNETDEQQGVAHFLEHMAFNGTKRFPAGETFEYFQRLGMAFGAHTNAETEIDRTFYQLELPRANEELTGDGLKLFRDFLDGMLLDEKEIDKERGVILSEQSARNTAAYRSAVQNIRASLAGTKAAERLPLGKPETVRSAKRKEFVDFYETWYTPGRTVIIAVGDFDTAMVERLIRANFADAKARRGEAADVSLGKVRTDAGLRSRFASVPDAGGTTVSIVRAKPVRPTVEQLADQREHLIDLLVDRIFSTRLERLTEAKDTPLQAVGAGDDRQYNLADRYHISARCRPEKWSEALSLIERETRRALLHGFTDAELDVARQAAGTFFDYYLGQLEMEQPTEIASEILKSVYEGNVYTDNDILLPMLKKELTKITAADCDAAFRKRWATDDLEIAVTGDADLKGDASAQIMTAFKASAKQPVESNAAAELKEFVYTDFGPAGEIVSRREHSDLGIVQAVFANNVRVNVKSTQFDKGQARVVVHFGGGMLETPIDKPCLNLLAMSGFINGGLKKLTIEELNRHVEGKFVSVTFNVSEESFQVGGLCLARDLELQLQLCAAYLSEPAYRADHEADFYAYMDGLYSQREHSLEGRLRYDASAFLRSGDYRYAMPEKEAIRRLKMSDVEAWLAKPLAESYMEVTLVGDFDTEAALKLVAKTLGALPKRADKKADFREARKVKFPETKLKQFTYTGDAPRAMATVCWQVPGVSDVTVNRRLYVLHLVLADRVRLKLREELGAAYTPELTYYSSYAYPEFGFIAAFLAIDPAAAAKLADVTIDVATELAAGSITDDEFARAVKPYLNEIEQQRLTNSYWIGAICDAHERPEGLDVIRSKPEAYATMAKADVEKLAKQYLTRDAATTILIGPATPAGPAGANTPTAEGGASK